MLFYSDKKKVKNYYIAHRIPYKKLIFFLPPYVHVEFIFQHLLNETMLFVKKDTPFDFNFVILRGNIIFVKYMFKVELLRHRENERNFFYFKLIIVQINDT